MKKLNIMIYTSGVITVIFTLLCILEKIVFYLFSSDLNIQTVTVTPGGPMATNSTIITVIGSDSIGLELITAILLVITIILISIKVYRKFGGDYLSSNNMERSKYLKKEMKSWMLKIFAFVSGAIAIIAISIKLFLNYIFSRVIGIPLEGSGSVGIIGGQDGPTTIVITEAVALIGILEVITLVSVILTIILIVIRRRKK